MPIYGALMRYIPRQLAFLEYEPLVQAAKTLNPEALSANAVGANYYGAGTVAGLVQKAFRRQAPHFDKHPALSTDVLNWTKSVLPVKSDSLVLDCGAGTGAVSRILAPHVKHVVATDISRHMIAIGEEKNTNEKIANITYERAENDALPFLDNSFDVVFSRLNVHHQKDPRTFLKELVRVVKPGGVVGIIDQIRPSTLSARIAARMNYLESLRDISHQNFYSGNELAQLVRDAGVEVSQANHTGVGAGLTAVIEAQESLENWISRAEPNPLNIKILSASIEGNAEYGTDYDQETGFQASFAGEEAQVKHIYGAVVGTKRS